jgi:Bacterial Ig domain/Protein of unknown function (DUF1565)
MHASDLACSVRALAFALTFAGLAGCGGDGPAPAPNVTVAEGGTVTSEDGKVQLFVEPQSASADATGTIRKVAPPADAASRPGYVADSAYAWSGPDLDFSPAARWEIESPRAVEAAPAASGEFALAVARSGDIDVERMCQAPYARDRGRPAQNVWVAGESCPIGCSKERSADVGTRNARSFCVAKPELQVMADTSACPQGSSDVSAEPAWAAVASDRRLRFCDSTPSLGAALLGRDALTATSSCVKQNGRFGCSVPTVKGSTVGNWVIEGDTEPPNRVQHGFNVRNQPLITENRSGPGYLAEMIEGGGLDLFFAPSAEDEGWGLYDVRLYEYIGLAELIDGAAPAVITRKLWWHSPPANTEGLGPLAGLAGALEYDAACCAAIPYFASGPGVRYFFAEAIDMFGNTRRTPTLRVAKVLASAPTIQAFAANPPLVSSTDGATVLSWRVDGATNVNILPSLGNVGTSNGSAPVVITQTTVYTLTATNAFGQTATKSIIVKVQDDTTPPVVTLASSATSVVVPDTVTLTATASDDVGVAKVEFVRGVTVIATDLAAPYQHSLALGAADVGMVTIRARAYDAAGNVSPVSGVTLNVTDPPGNGDTYASPTGVDAGNSTCAQATPCLTIAKAASLAQANKTVWLANGLYSTATQPAPITIPAGLTVRAINAGLARVSQGIVLQGSGSVVGIVLPRDGLFESGYIQATSGTVLIDGVRVTGTASITSGVPAPITLAGTAQATMTPGAIADYADQLAPAGQGKATYATLAGTSRLTVSGGTFGGAALGGADGVNGSVGRGAFILSGDSRLDLDGVVLNVDSSGIAMQGGATQLFMTGSTLNSNVNTGSGAGVHAARGTPQITLTNSSITGFANSYSASSAGVLVGLFAQPGVAATITGTGATVRGNDAGILVQDAGTTPTSLTLGASDLIVSAGTYGGIVCRAACSIDIAGGAVSDNGTSGALSGSGTFLGGLWLGETTKTYSLKLRNVLVTDNRSALTNNTNQPDNSGITLRGNATSGFDLGTAASPGGNVFTGNTTGSQTAGLNVGVAAGITVRAAGNTFIAGVQGADAGGLYQLGAAPCGPASCDVNSTAGSGANFRVGSGVLRLAP